METEIISKRENPLFGRIEIEFRAIHSKEPTPTSETLRQEIAKIIKAAKENVIIDYARSEFGRAATRGYAKIYKSKEDAMRLERKHILVRNQLLKAEKKEEKKAERPKKVEKIEAKEEVEAKPEEKAKKAPKKEEAK